MNVTLNDLFELMNKAKREMNSKSNKSSKSSKSSNNEKNERAFVKNFEMRVGLDQTYGPPTVEDYKVVQYVTYVFYTMYPMKEGDVYPEAWKDGVVYTYQKIREQRSKLRKSGIKDGMKGMRLQVVVGVLLYCTLIQQQENLMPVPIFVKFLNTALKRYLTKEDKKPIDVQTFERYRTESKPLGVGIKPYLKKALPLCYGDIEPEDMIQFTGYTLLSLKRPEVFRARKIASLAKGGFSDTTPPSNIAIAALYIVGMQNNSKITEDDFGITKARLRQSVKQVLKTSESNTALKSLLKNFVLAASPGKSSKKKSSMK
jgi:hypothetical protein